MKSEINSDDVVIAGIGLYPVGEHWDISLRAMGARAVRAAIDNCGGLEPQGVFVGNAFASILSHQANLAALIADEAGLSGVEACSFEAAGASGGAAVRAAYLDLWTALWLSELKKSPKIRVRELLRHRT